MKKFVYALAVALPLTIAGNAMANGCDMEDLNKATKEVQEDYNDAIKVINESSLSTASKDTLKEQAKENKDLATKYLNNKTELCNKHKEQRAKMKTDLEKADKGKKALKKVKKIGDI